MFDTVVLKARPIHIESEVLLSQKNCKSVTLVDVTTGALITKYEIYDEQLPYIKYLDSSRTLSIQVSIPKLLYGNNVTLTTEQDILDFFSSVQRRIGELFTIYIPHSEWLVTRSDVCWNFQVGKNVRDYIRMLSKQKLAFKTTKSYNQDQTVEFYNKSSRIMFYDKHEQLQTEKVSADLLDHSKGILRLEINPSYSDMKKFSTTKNAVELLKKPFFDYMTNKVLNEIDYPSVVSNISFSWLNENKESITKIETLLGFQKMQNMFDESVLKQVYTSSTYANRKTLAKKMTIPTGNCLEPLVINQ
ncbi:hypothetical protein D3C74_241760 [compost metagenome]